MIKTVALILTLCATVQGFTAFAYNTDYEYIRKKQREFASQYDYHEGDWERSFDEYPGVDYTSGEERRADGSIYECPAIYIDYQAIYYNSFTKEETNVTFKINGTAKPEYSKCVLINSRLLVPAEAFKDVGCDVDFNDDTYVLTVSKDGVILEILPNLIGMRKGHANGFYVPLSPCARFIDDKMYVPVRAVAQEFDLKISWNEETRTVELDN